MRGGAKQEFKDERIDLRATNCFTTSGSSRLTSAQCDDLDVRLHV